MSLRYLWGVGLCAILLTACATGSRVTKITYSKIPKVKITYSDIVPDEAPTGVMAPEALSIAYVPVEEGLPGFPLQEDRGQGALPVLGARISSQEALSFARAWMTEGLRQYERGEIEEAHKSLSNARLIFREASLPDAVEAKGLSLFRSDLPAELRRYNPDEIAKKLDKVDRSNLAGMAERALVEKEVRSLLSQFGDPSPEDRYADALIDETQRYIQFYRGPWHGFYERALIRKYKYWPTIQQVFIEKHVSLDYGYLALVESGFQPKAISPAQAKGVWQFIPGTGKRYGLQSLEDFYDVYQSTGAAASYLRELTNIFGSRLLALAAYNSGEWKVVGCLRKLDRSEKRSFWEIRGCLPEETRKYVPKIMAAAVIGSDPKRFGFDVPSEEEIRKKFDVIVVPRKTSLVYLADLAGVSVSSLREMNSEIALTVWETPCRNFPLYVPRGTGAPIVAALATAPAERVPSITPLSPMEPAPGSSVP